MKLLSITKRQILILVVIISVQLILLANSKFTIWPEMILYPWLLNKGYILYTDIINPYFPLLQLMVSSFFYLFGASIINLKIFTYLMIIAADVCIFLLSYKVSKNFLSAVICLSTYILFQYSFGGNGLWFELGLVPFIFLATVLFYLKPSNNKVILISGLLISIAGLIKQNAFLFLAPLLAFSVLNNKATKIRILLFPVFITITVLVLALNYFGVLNEFFKWAIELPLTMSNQPGFVILPSKRQMFLISLLLLPLLFFYFVKRNLKEKVFWTLIVLVSLFFAFPRYEDFHLQVLVAFVSFLTVFLYRKWQLLFLGIAVLIFIFNFQKLWQQPDRFLDQGTINLGTYIKNLPGDVYLLNSPELAYFLADKNPPKPWGTIFPWYFEGTNLSERIIKDMENNETEYVIMGERMSGTKYQLGHYIPEPLERYIDDRYEVYEKFESYEVLKRK